MRNSIYALLLTLSLTACNLYGGLSKPGNDQQYLLAARSCLDRGDYACAKENYNALSASFDDVKISETSLTIFAENNIFSISELVGSLGTNIGSASSFKTLAESLAQKGVTSGDYRTIIKTRYDADSSITDAKLKAFAKFIAALSMFNEVLANAVGADGSLTASDIVTAANVTACKAGSACDPNCTAPTGTAMTYNSSDTSDLTLATSTTNDWSGAATIQKLVKAASEAQTEMNIFAPTSTNQGLLKAIQDLASISGAEPCARKLLIDYLAL